MHAARGRQLFSGAFAGNIRRAIRPQSQHVSDRSAWTRKDSRPRQALGSKRKIGYNTRSPSLCTKRGSCCLCPSHGIGLRLPKHLGSCEYGCHRICRSWRAGTVANREGRLWVEASVVGSQRIALVVSKCQSTAASFSVGRPGNLASQDSV